MTQTEMLLTVLKNGKLHRNFDIIREIKARFYNGCSDLSMFPLAARIWDLVKPKDRGGKYGLKIESGNPEHFNKVRQSRGDWYYQLQPKVEVRTKHLFGIEPIMRPGPRQQSLYPTGIIPKTRDLSRKVGNRN